MTNYNFDYFKDASDRDQFIAMQKNYKREKPLEVLFLDHAIVLPRKEAEKPEDASAWMGIGGVLNSEGEFVRLSGIEGFRQNEGKLVFGGMYEYEGEPGYVDEEVLYMGAFQPHWGHFILEYCTRLWYYIQNPQHIRIVMCGFSCEADSIDGNFLKFLNLIGIEKSQIIDVRKPMQFKRVIVPEQSFLRDKYFTDAYRMLIECACQNISVNNLKPYEKVYFTRSNFANSKERGEFEIKQIFEKNGYACLAPEMLSVEEQMFYIRNCKEFVVIPGGASMNGVFAAKHTKRIYIKKANQPDFPADVLQIDQMTEADEVTFIDCYYKPYKSLPNGYGPGPHFLGVTKQLKDYAKNHHMKITVSPKYMIARVKNWLWLTKIIVIRKYLAITNKINGKRV